MAGTVGGKGPDNQFILQFFQIFVTAIWQGDRNFATVTNLRMAGDGGKGGLQ